jgi:hypothetical protein
MLSTDAHSEHVIMRDVSKRSLAALKERIRGTVIRPIDGRYDDARRVWNAMIDRYPALIVQCADASDVRVALDFGQEHRLPIALRGGGHSVAGNGTCDSGLVIDLSPMRGIVVAVDDATVEAEGGVRWGELDAATAAHGLATTGGLISTTGIAGLTLGGGIGWLMRRYGLSCDNLIRANLVTPSGREVVVDEEIEPELLWGLRGGGANLGVVTRFEYRLHPVSTIVGGMLMYRLEDAADLVMRWDELVAKAPDELTTMAAFITAPPAPFVPEALHGQKVLAIIGCWCGEPDAAEPFLASLRKLRRPDLDLLGPMPYSALQSMLDAAAPPGLRNYWKSGQLHGLDGRDVARLEVAAREMDSPLSQIHLHQLGGAVARVPVDATAFPHRAATHTLNVISTWTDAAEDDLHISWSRKTAAALDSSISGVYVNFLGSEGHDRVVAAYGQQT